MLEFYPQIRDVHIAAILLSGGWFALRALAILAGLRWPRALAARVLGWTIDATLLTAATMLWSILPGELFANGWLTAKLVFVAIYLAAGWSSLQPRAMRSCTLALAGTAALAWVLAYGIARSHDPWGWFA